MHELQPVPYRCGYCGEENESLIDPSGGSEQEYTEDCTVCCRPNFLRIRTSPDGQVTLTVEYEG